MSDSPNDDDRRSKTERRNTSKRRRHADARRVCVELCHSVLRVVIVVDGEQGDLPTIRTRTVRWRIDAPSLTCDQGRVELGASLRRIVNEDRLAGCAVSFAISSTLCVNRATSGASTKVEQDIIDLRDRSQMYLALGPGPKTTAVGRKQIDARHEHALVTVANERTLDLLVDAAKSAGLIVKLVESALVALSRLQGQIESNDPSAVILAQLDEERFEIGVSRAGQLLLEYRPSSDTTVAQLGRVVDDHHDRLKRFCARQYGVGQMELTRMWLVGEPNEVDATNSKTNTQLATGVLPLDRLNELWQLDQDQLPTAEMGAALGVALSGRCEDSGVSPNLMDDIHARAKTPIRPILLRAAVPIAASLLLAACLWGVNIEQQVELSALRAKVDQIKPALLRGERLAREITDAATEIQHLSHLEERTPRREISPLIQRMGHCLPDDVWLKSIRLLEGSEVSVTGASYSESGVYDFVRHLETAPQVEEVALLGTGIDQTPEGPATSFDIDIDLDAAMAVPAPNGADQ